MTRPYLFAAALLSAAPLPAQPALSTPRDSALHALNRLAYGATPGLADRIAREGVLRWIDRQLGVTQVDDPGLNGVLARFDLLGTRPDQLLRTYLEAQRSGGPTAGLRPPTAPGPR